jgi:hypothetical protein
MLNKEKEIQGRERSLISIISLGFCLVEISILIVNLSTEIEYYLQTILGYILVISLLLSFGLATIDVLKSKGSKIFPILSLIITFVLVLLLLYTPMDFSLL